jgi:hypothetical protein
MPEMKLAVPHHLQQDDAAARIKGLIKQVQEQYASKVSNLKESWEGHIGNFSFEVMGFPVSGILKIEPSEVLMTGKIPLAAMPFKGMIETTLREKITGLLK